MPRGSGCAKRGAHLHAIARGPHHQPECEISSASRFLLPHFFAVSKKLHGSEEGGGEGKTMELRGFRERLTGHTTGSLGQNEI